MSDKAEKKPEAAPEKKDGAKPAASGGGGMLTKTPVLLGGVMFLEAIVLFAGFKFIAGGAKNANAADLTVETRKEGEAGKEGGDGKKPKVVELDLLDSSFPNKASGKTLLYKVKIALEVKSEFEEAVKKAIAARDALIKDRVRTIIAQSDPDKLGGASEPGLETLRRQVKYQLDELIGDGMIDEVVVPVCIPYPDY